MGVSGPAVYCVFPVLLPLELPEPMLLLEPLPVEPLLLEPLLLGEVVELAPELDLLKYASHSERETCPSLFVSTDEKLGVEALLLEAPRLPPEDEVLGEVDEPLEEPPAADGEEELEPLLMPVLPLPLLPDEELCPAATPDSANSAAAVAMPTNFSFNIG